MTILNDILSAHDRAQHAIDSGTQMHARLQHVFVDGATIRGDTELARKIKSFPELLPFFGTNSQTEVPIAGTIHGRFISRRIDRLIIDDANQTVNILDYKTDTNPDIYRDKYIVQLREYIALLRVVYPHHRISAYLLWTHDFSLEKVA